MVVAQEYDVLDEDVSTFLVPVYIAHSLWSNATSDPSLPSEPVGFETDTKQNENLHTPLRFPVGDISRGAPVTSTPIGKIDAHTSKKASQYMCEKNEQTKDGGIPQADACAQSVTGDSPYSKQHHHDRLDSINTQYNDVSQNLDGSEAGRSLTNGVRALSFTDQLDLQVGGNDTEDAMQDNDGAENCSFVSAQGFEVEPSDMWSSALSGVDTKGTELSTGKCVRTQEKATSEESIESTLERHSVIVPESIETRDCTLYVHRVRDTLFFAVGAKQLQEKVRTRN